MPADKDHPRSRGVYLCGECAAYVANGSSPLARGLRSVSQVQSLENWIIPARAGFTSPPTQDFGPLPDHPRSRGVYSSAPSSGSSSPGSSPLARGLLTGLRSRRSRPGIIPARAGFTTTCSTRSSSTPDHPRSRGVYSVIVVSETGQRGSSPLARGLRGGTVEVTVQGRIIPARAGFTRGRPQPC